MSMTFVLKKAVKSCLPHGIVIFLERRRNWRFNHFSFKLDSDFRVKGWMEPAHVHVELDINDWIQGQIFRNGMYEAESVLKLEELMPQGGTFFDIGANIGIYSLNLFRKAENVFAFEATQKTYNILEKTISENSIKNIHLALNAVDAKDNEDVLIYSRGDIHGLGNIGANSMYSGDSVANVVKSVTLDKFVRSNSISRIDIIKIDIEGNELRALQGARECIERFRPIIFCEINPELSKKAGHEAGDLFDFIVNELKYEAKILRKNILRPIGRGKAICRQQNIFFVPLKQDVGFLK